MWREDMYGRLQFLGGALQVRAKIFEGPKDLCRDSGVRESVAGSQKDPQKRGCPRCSESMRDSLEPPRPRNCSNCQDPQSTPAKVERSQGSDTRVSCPSGLVREVLCHSFCLWSTAPMTRSEVKMSKWENFSWDPIKSGGRWGQPV